jgi:DEAD/DEAH box helicase domain-containing protein
LALDELIGAILDDPEFGPLVRHVERLPARQATTEPLPGDLAELVRERLRRAGISELFSHQADAYRAVRRGEHVCVVTGTSSGKSLCYNLPVLDTNLAYPAARALYVFPTKALAQDQAGKLLELAAGLNLRTATYDGDTPQAQRPAIRKSAHVVVTNPDMLHLGILPQHELWGAFLRNLRYIVLDELHTYRGVFGSHVAGVLRRLLRLAEWRGARPQIIACSATIGNPEELFETLTGGRARLVDRDGSPRSERAVLVVSREVEAGGKSSPNKDTSAILARLALLGKRTMAFCRARVTTEIVLRATRACLRDFDFDPSRIESYRGGYTPQERREIERHLFAGRLLGLATTTAMELGVDVGTLDAVLMNGFPGSIASFWQQAGRAGRGLRPGLAAWVAHPSPLEQFVARDPSLIFGAPIENAVANPDNPFVLADQLRCAAYERAILERELDAFGPQARGVASGLCEAGELTHRPEVGQYFYPAHESPAASVNIRGIAGERITLLANGQPLGEMERWRALRQAHTGAVYLHRGQTYLCQELDLANRVAILGEESPGYFTQPVVQTLVEPMVKIRERLAGLHRVVLAGLKLTSVVAGYRQMALDGEHMLGLEELDMPSETFETIGAQVDVDLSGAAGFDLGAGAVHALEHALVAVAPLIAGCDRGDLGSAWYGTFPDTMRPAAFVYDATPGGVGLAEALFERWETWSAAALRLVDSCVCGEGCPACLMSPWCEKENEGLDKAGGLRVLRGLA